MRYAHVVVRVHASQHGFFRLHVKGQTEIDNVVERFGSPYCNDGGTHGRRTVCFKLYDLAAALSEEDPAFREKQTPTRLRSDC